MPCTRRCRSTWLTRCANKKRIIGKRRAAEEGGRHSDSFTQKSYEIGPKILRNRPKNLTKLTPKILRNWSQNHTKLTQKSYEITDQVVCGDGVWKFPVAPGREVVGVDDVLRSSGWSRDGCDGAWGQCYGKYFWQFSAKIFSFNPLRLGPFM
jgi:hypothetical protein